MTNSFLISALILLTMGLPAQNNSAMKNINQQAPVRCGDTISINANITNVWQVLTHINNWPAWQSDISKARLNGELQALSTFDWKTGGAKIHSTIHTAEFPKNFGWTGRTFGLFAIHNWTLTEKEGKTIVQVEESMEGLLARLLKKSFNKNLETGMRTWLELLKKACEK